MDIDNIQVPEIAFGREVYKANLIDRYVEEYKKLSVQRVDKRDYRLISNYSDWLMLCRYIDKPIRYNDFQKSLIDCQSRFVNLVKARQLGFSFCIAGRAVARSHVKKASKNIFVSYNLREAKEKIEIARIISDGVPTKIKKKITTNNQLEIGYENGSKIFSLFSPRGFSHADVYLDEFAFYENPRQSYNDSLPVATAPRFNDTQLFVGSSPFGKVGLFYDIVNGTDGKYNNYDKHVWFWWDSPFYCNNVSEARIEAAFMPTVDRVEKYGTSSLQDIYSNMLEEDFQQEFECYFCDEAQSFISYDLIKSCMGYYDADMQADYPQRLDDIRSWIKGTLYAGYDVGRIKDASEFYVFDYRVDNSSGEERCELVQVFNKSLDGLKFKDQRNFLYEFLYKYQDCIGSLQMDQSQIGRNLVEDLQENFATVVGIDFTNQSKERMATTMKMFMSEGIIKLFPDRETVTQVHSIKQLKTAFNHIRFDVEGTKKHHADRFWAIALAVDGANRQGQVRPEIIVVRGDVKKKNSWENVDSKYFKDKGDYEKRTNVNNVFRR